jgi:hypothetical protein
MKSGSQIFFVKRIEPEINFPAKTPEIKDEIKPIEPIHLVTKGFLRFKKNRNYFTEKNLIFNGRWDEREHKTFLESSIVLGNNWKKVNF